VSLLWGLSVPPGMAAGGLEAGRVVYDFENGTTMGWNQGWGVFEELEALTVSGDLQTDGNQYALKANVRFGQPDWQAAALTLHTAAALGEYTLAEFEVYVPADYPGEFIIDTAMNNGWEGLRTTR